MKPPDLTLLPPDEIHVWRARIDSRAAARQALGAVLGRYLEAKPEEIELRLGPHGKPALALSEEPLRFNLSHSGELALIGVTRGREIGVDVEGIDRGRDVLALAPRALGPAEAAAIRKLPAAARSAAFHAAWTRREAIAKCLGVGLGVPLPEAAVTVSDLDAGPGFAAAVAVAGDGIPPIRRFDSGLADGAEEGWGDFLPTAVRAHR